MNRERVAALLHEISRATGELAEALLDEETAARHPEPSRPRARVNDIDRAAARRALSRVGVRTK